MDSEKYRNLWIQSYRNPTVFRFTWFEEKMAKRQPSRPNRMKLKAAVPLNWRYGTPPPTLTQSISLQKNVLRDLNVKGEMPHIPVVSKPRPLFTLYSPLVAAIPRSEAPKLLLHGDDSTRRQLEGSPRMGLL